MGFSFKRGSRRYIVDLRKVKNPHNDLGLMFKSRNTRNLLFTFARAGRVAITSWFVFFPFLAVWLDKNKRVTEHRIVQPFIFSFKPKKNAKYLIELPFNAKNSSIIKKLVKN